MPSVSFLRIHFPRSPGRAAFRSKHAPVGLNKSTDARDQSQSAANRHRSERAHPRLPWHSQCPLAGIGRGTECCAWLDAPRFAAKPRVQGRLASEEEFGPSCEYAPTALTIKPDLFARTMTVRASAARAPKFASARPRAFYSNESKKPSFHSFRHNRKSTTAAMMASARPI